MVKMGITSIRGTDMKEETKETIDYAVKKLDNFFGKVVAEGGELTNEFVAYALLELHIYFAIACIVTVVGICCLSLLYICRDWEIDTFGEGMIPITIVSIMLSIGGIIAIMINGYDMYMASKFPLMWVISNKVM